MLVLTPAVPAWSAVGFADSTNRKSKRETLNNYLFALECLLELLFAPVFDGVVLGHLAVDLLPHIYKYNFG